MMGYSIALSSKLKSSKRYDTENGVQSDGADGFMQDLKTTDKPILDN